MGLPNITALRNSLRQAGWCMTAFDFNFHGVNSLVLFEDAKVLGRKEKYVSVILTFRDYDDLNRYIEVAANAGGIDLTKDNRQAFFDFFYIQYGEFDNFWNHFNAFFNTAIPQEFVIPQNEIHRNVIAEQLSARNHDPDPNAIYCYEAYRLGKHPKTNRQENRSPFIDTKTRLLRPQLYEAIDAANEPTITFKYSSNPDMGQTDATILHRFAQNNY
jgi:hypothetical protein